MAAAGTQVFETPDVLPVEAWFERLWTSLDHDRELLRESAELHLWRQVIAADLESVNAGETLTPHQVAQFASSSAEAWQRIRRWQEPRWADMALTPDVEAFARWVAAFVERLGERWITAAELPDRLAADPAALRAHVPEQIVFLGFERTEPALRRLIDSLAQLGVKVVEPAETTVEGATPVCAPAATIDAEVRRLASDVRADIERDPSAKIGILAADLSAYRSLLERYLSAELDPSSLVPVPGRALPRQRRVFDLAGAPALGDYGVIAHALDLLGIAYRDNAFDDVSRILLAPYPRRGDAAQCEREAELRARVELELRRDNKLSIGIDALADTAEAVSATEFAASLRALAKVLPTTPRRALPSAWARHVIARLGCFGWPGGAIDHDGDEGVAYGRWRDIMDEFAALDSVCDAMTAAEAQAEIRRLCASNPVQAPSGGLGVQAMGLLDAAGLHFDKVYVIGLTADVFPAPTHPHPLLPAQWQRAAGFPLASPQGEAEFAAGVWRRVRASCNELIASWPRTGDRGAHNVPSPVLGREASATAFTQATDERAMPWYSRPQAREGVAFDEPDDGSVPPALVRRGGTSLLKDHSACPFRAFAGIRLRTDRMDEPEPEPKPSTRGDLVHRTLELVWGALGDSTALRALSDEAVIERVRPAAEAAMARAYPSADADTNASLLGWLVEQVTGWLRFERETLLDGSRADWRIGAVEERTDVPLGIFDGEPAVRLRRLSVDRIDVLADESVLIIDYKTSSTAMTPNQWRSDRPKEPQLPIYAVALRTEGRAVAGVAFANLESRDKVGFKGVADEPILAKAIEPEKSDWPGIDARIDQWAATLSALAEDFAAGNAAVSPRSAREDCTWCGRQPLCRIFESEDDDADGAADAE